MAVEEKTRDGVIIMSNGSVEELPSGRFRARVSINGKKKKLGIFDTREEAEGMAAAASMQLHEQSKRGRIVEAKEEPETLTAYGVRWLRERELKGKDRAMQSKWSLWNAHVVPSKLGAMALDDITKRDVKAWLAAMDVKEAVRKWPTGSKSLGRRISWKTVRSAMCVLRQCFAAAVEAELIDVNPMADVEHDPDKATTKEPWTFLTTDEIERVVTCPKIPDDKRLLFTVAIYTGLRRGELWGLHWRDVVLDGPRPEITVRFSNKGPTKTGKVRRVPLLAPAREALMAVRKAAGNPTGADLVFPGADGEHKSKHYDGGWSGYRNNKRSAWKGYREAAGIRPEVRFHDMRHTCASHLVMGTWGRQWTLQEVAKLLGHSNVRTTEIYAHLSPDHLHKAAQATPGMVAPTTAPMVGQVVEVTQGLDGKAITAPTRVVPVASPVHGRSVGAWAGLLRVIARGEVVPQGLVEHLLDELIGDELARVAARLRHTGYTLNDVVDLATAVIVSA